MTWSNKQKSIAAAAARTVGWEKQQRQIILMRFDNRAIHRGEVTSTSPKLTNADFEQFMAVIEQKAGGQVLHYSRGYWQRKADDPLHRTRHECERIARSLELEGHLLPDGAGLAGWISKRVTGGRTDRLDNLNAHELKALLEGLKNHAESHGVELYETDTAPPPDSDLEPAPF